MYTCSFFSRGDDPAGTAPTGSWPDAEAVSKSHSRFPVRRGPETRHTCRSGPARGRLPRAPQSAPGREDGVLACWPQEAHPRHRQTGVHWASVPPAAAQEDKRPRRAHALSHNPSVRPTGPPKLERPRAHRRHLPRPRRPATPRLPSGPGPHLSSCRIRRSSRSRAALSSLLSGLRLLFLRQQQQAQHTATARSRAPPTTDSAMISASKFTARSAGVRASGRGPEAAPHPGGRRQS